MKNLSNFKNVVEAKTFKISGDKIQQTERNQLKKDILDALFEDLSNVFDTERTNDGAVILLEVENESIYVSIDAVVKNLDYDVVFEAEEYALKIEKQAEREAERLRKAEERANAKK